MVMGEFGCSLRSPIHTILDFIENIARNVHARQISQKRLIFYIIAMPATQYACVEEEKNQGREWG